MKFFNLCLFVLPFFISCSDSSDSMIVSKSSSQNQNLNSYRSFENSPENTSNPYDISGQLYAALYAAYFETDSLYTTLSDVSERVTLLANQNTSFVSLAGIPYSNTNKARVAYIMKYGDCCSQDIIGSLIGSEAAAIGFTNFVASVVAFCDVEDDYALIYSYVVSYENEVLTSKSINDADKKIILTTTSVIRYAAYERKRKPKKNTDPDWDMMIGNIVGSVDGASTSVEDAVVISLICGVMENEF